MSTDIATTNHRDVAGPAPAPERPATDLELWAHEARQVNQIAVSLAKTSFVPASLRGKPEDITAAILAGREMGMKPMATLKSIDVIQGTPALRAHAMRALLQSHGHEIELVESDPKHCVMRGRRAGGENWQTVAWDLARAAQMGLTGKAEWKKQPQTMLVARATGEICRLVAADVLYAMPYAAEELRDHRVSEVEPAPRVTAAEILGTTPAAAAPESAAEAVSPDDRDVDAYEGVHPEADQVDWPPVAGVPDGES